MRSAKRVTAILLLVIAVPLGSVEVANVAVPSTAEVEQISAKRKRRIGMAETT